MKYVSLLTVLMALTVLAGCQTFPTPIPDFVSDFESKATAAGYVPVCWGYINGRPFASFYLEESKWGSTMLLVVGGKFDEATQKKLSEIAQLYRWSPDEGGAISVRQSRVEGPDGNIMWGNPVDFAVLGVNSLSEAKKAMDDFQNSP